MITIRRNSLTYALASFPDAHGYREPNNYCNFFWTMIGKAAVLLAVCFFVGSMLGMYVASWVIDPMDTLLRTGGVLLLIVVTIGVLYAGIRITVSVYVRAYKERHCPRVTYVDIHD